MNNEFKSGKLILNYGTDNEVVIGEIDSVQKATFYASAIDMPPGDSAWEGVTKFTGKFNNTGAFEFGTTFKCKNIYRCLYPLRYCRAYSLFLHAKSKRQKKKQLKKLLEV